MHFEIRPTRPNEIPIVMDLLQQGRETMRSRGNHSQWVGYPTESDVLEDIAKGISHLLLDNGTPVATFALLTTPEPTYTYIEGSWLDDTTPYGTIHRLARSKNIRGIAETVFAWCETQCPSLRADTHADNIVVQRILLQQGYTYCGIVYMTDGSPRRAYQKMLYPTLPITLKQYIQSAILPQYDAFDAAHQRDHALRVMAQSISLAQHYPELNKAMVYTIAACHDIGLAESRETHHTASGQRIRRDSRLLEWFTPEQREVMAQAAEDHRASANHPPRSLYGRIVSEADRDIDPDTIILRTVQYGLSHYPEKSPSEQVGRALQHLHEKYGRNGYLKLFIPESRNGARLERLRQLIEDEEAIVEKINALLHGQ